MATGSPETLHSTAQTAGSHRRTRSVWVPPSPPCLSPVCSSLDQHSVRHVQLTSPSRLPGDGETRVQAIFGAAACFHPRPSRARSAPARARGHGMWRQVAGGTRGGLHPEAERHYNPPPPALHTSVPLLHAAPLRTPFVLSKLPKCDVDFHIKSLRVLPLGFSLGFH